ncbi:polyglutamine-binding protein 1 [Euwallacea fornicatus]|uniref:polyglutamine-binding protein 1 n=1 Tax=Euwallacea fornicatus TaxID=995702 RepID=UPI00339053D6
MPLPPALAAKLAKRGLIASKNKQSSEPTKKNDYKGLSTCPNKSNIFHECTVWCKSHWLGVLTPDPRYVRNMQKLLAKYPLLNNWTEVFDKGLGRYYYWNMENDIVSWLPPKHPRAVLTKSAAKLREKYINEQRDKRLKEREELSKKDRAEKDGDRGHDRDSDEDDRGHRSKYSERRDRDRDRDRDDKRGKRDRDREERHRRDRDKRKREEQLDPMDPSTYSDVPQGTWSDGLETNKMRADNTASGVLFQQRPYPAPGAVLAANREKEDKERRK